jgi:hypothetical protein
VKRIALDLGARHRGIEKPRSNAALWPTSTARRQSCAFIALRTSVKMRPSASFSGMRGAQRMPGIDAIHRERGGLEIGAFEGRT